MREIKKDGSSTNKPSSKIEDPTISINFENAKELQQLVLKASTLSKELHETLQQIEEFQLNIKVK